MEAGRRTLSQPAFAGCTMEKWHSRGGGKAGVFCRLMPPARGTAGNAASAQGNFCGPSESSLRRFIQSVGAAFASGSDCSGEPACRPGPTGASFWRAAGGMPPFSGRPGAVPSQPHRLSVGFGPCPKQPGDLLPVQLGGMDAGTGASMRRVPSPPSGISCRWENGKPPALLPILWGTDLFRRAFRRFCFRPSAGGAAAPGRVCLGAVRAAKGGGISPKPYDAEGALR